MTNDNQKDVVKKHSYDGIQEYDNKLPRWWVGTFILTVIFGLGYWFYYQVFDIGKSQVEAYNDVLGIQASEAKEKSAESEVLFDLAAVEKIQADAHEMDEAKQVFQQNCIACHGPEAGGGIGPNLTDDYWIHGAGVQDIFAVIQNGVVEKGMLAWKGVLSREKIEELVAYVLSLRGTQPKDAIGPQGELVIPAK
ncbi:MAG: hypothetical protein COX62_00270 [Deltaproteobacteria bacterium CG_4_10_14_0_2_um_filter_43_8]|nr:MAG: hypothetical protein COV43_00215 [Deltaproteobacteria bacterium CG11_big_fil_rev_8_21_14_0_20_42_23]PJA22289.1 MAG: hypothetical protein COX62_00270 [Deltaproteobacteria bacterium CG_4_10_14_0_2_um_filter_43_8]PJC64442.1 MAG: hypothetical protein CO021_04120 [Deltaproteobacteria bacterium CG_4_9_14_0_2_um_filter_42_21]